MGSPRKWEGVEIVDKCCRVLGGKWEATRGPRSDWSSQ